MAGAAIRPSNQYPLTRKPLPYQAELLVHVAAKVTRQILNFVGGAVFQSGPRHSTGARQNRSRCSVESAAAVIRPERNSAGAVENQLALEPFSAFLIFCALQK